MELWSSKEFPTLAAMILGAKRNMESRCGVQELKATQQQNVLDGEESESSQTFKANATLIAKRVA